MNWNICFILTLCMPFSLAFKLENNAGRTFNGFANVTRSTGGALTLIGQGIGHLIVTWLGPLTNAAGYLVGGIGSSLSAGTHRPNQPIGIHHDEISEDEYDSPFSYHETEQGEKDPTDNTEIPDDDFMQVYQHHSPNDRFKIAATTERMPEITSTTTPAAKD